MKTAALLLTAALWASGAGPDVMASRYAASDFPLTPDPGAPQWRDAPAVFAENDASGAPVPGHRTEIRSRWTDGNLYLLFICPYETLHLKPAPDIAGETNRLWEWDVAEAFIGSDFQNIRRYKEFQISPRGEWVDLDIDRDNPKPEGGWRWNSGFAGQARIDGEKKIWYGVMRIPLASIDSRRPANGIEMRMNLYRCQGQPPNRKFVAWRPTHGRSFHIPEAFGRLRLEGK